MKKKVIAAVLVAATLMFLVSLPTFAAPASQTYQVATDKNQVLSGAPLQVIATLKQAQPNCAYATTLTVTGPGGVSATDSVTVNTEAGGNGHTAASFPADFTGTANTNTVGTYTVTASFTCNYVTGTASTTFMVFK
jgi:hypothetical protein